MSEIMKESANTSVNVAGAKKKNKNGAIIALIVCVACLLVMNGCLIAFSVISNQKVSKFIDDERERQAKELEGEGYIEDGYVVGDQYEIKSTKAISDAYIAGDSSSLSGNDLSTYEMASAVIDEVIKDGMSDYEKEVAIYDWMCKNISTSEGGAIVVPGVSSTEAVSTPYGVLTGKQAVCVGYATTFRLLMNMLDIDVHIVHNDYHSWDLVHIGDSWYHVDIYSDSSTGNYANFNMTDSMARNGHEWNDEGYLPIADSYEYCYAYQNAVALDDITTIPATVYEAAYGVHENHAWYYNIGAYDDTKIAEISIMAEIMNGVFESGEDINLSNKNIETNVIPVDENTTLVALNLIDYSSGESGGDVDREAIYSQMIELINQTFGTNFYGGDYYYDYSEGRG